MDVIQLERAAAADEIKINGEICNICMEPYGEGQETYILSCLHKFHKSHIDHCTKKCPVCGKYTSASERSALDNRNQMLGMAALQDAEDNMRNPDQGGEWFLDKHQDFMEIWLPVGVLTFSLFAIYFKVYLK